MGPKKIIIGVVLALLAVAVLALSMVPKGGTGALPASGDISNQQLRDALARGARLIDVRTSAEYTGAHIPGAVNVPIDTVPSAAGSWDKDAPIALYCATGARSLNAFEFLKAQGFTRVYNLTQGIAAWDGETVSGADAGTAAGALPATTLPTLYDFSTSS